MPQTSRQSEPRLCHSSFFTQEQGVPLLLLGSPGFVHGMGFVPAQVLKSAVPQVKRFQSGFAGSPNKLAHALNGNYCIWEAPLPEPNTWKWTQSFFIPNGMRIFDYGFNGERDYGYTLYVEPGRHILTCVDGNLPLFAGSC